MATQSLSQCSNGDLYLLEARLADALHHGTKNDKIHEVWLYHLASGGSRFRARLAIEVGLAAKVPRHTRIAVASAVEFLHQASLVFDDLQEKDPIRRDKPAIWAAFDEATAVNLGTALVSTAFSEITGIDKAYQKRLPELLHLMTEAINVTVRGQQEDLSNLNRNLSFQEYLDIVKRKSGPLIGLPMTLIMAVKQETSACIQLCNGAAKHFGVAYQLIDDWNDHLKDDASINGYNILRYDCDHTDQVRDHMVKNIEASLGFAHGLCLQAPNYIHLAYDHFDSQIRRSLLGVREAA